MQGSQHLFGPDFLLATPINMSRGAQIDNMNFLIIRPHNDIFRAEI